MYYAITIDNSGRITGRHESAVELNAEIFAHGAYAGQEVRPVTQAQEYRAGFLMAEYDDGGKLRPLVDRILEGLTEVPDGYELIDGELVQTQGPEAEAPPTLLARVEAAEQAALTAHAEEARATRVLIRALAQTDVLTPAQALENSTMFDLWTDRIGTVAAQGEYLRHEDGLYRVQQAHTAEHPPSVNTAALYTRIQSPGAVQAWVTGQSYSKDVQVTHNGKTWLSRVPDNVWEPGAAGIGPSIWKEVI